MTTIDERRRAIDATSRTSSTPSSTGTRHVECDGAFNIRDLGGYPTMNGTTTRWQTIYRADGLHRVDQARARQLSELGWQTVLDLRTFDEVNLGVYRCDGVEVVHLPVLQEIWNVDLIDVTIDPVAFLVDRYLEMLVVGGGAFSAAIEILAAPGRRPAVFHCSAGKDRTGVLAAMVLAVAGVPNELIAVDYALTAAAMGRMLEWYRVNHPEVVDRMSQQPPALLACPAEAMLEFLTCVRDRHGSVERYLVDAGTSPSALEDLRAHLTSP